MMAQRGNGIGKNGCALVEAKIRSVRQRYRSDCGVACVAMVAGVPYQLAFSELGFSEKDSRFYTRHGQLAKALENLGCLVQRRRFRSWEDISGWAILPVNHRCSRQHFHWVVYDGNTVLDPYPTRPCREKDVTRYRASGWYLAAARL